VIVVIADDLAGAAEMGGMALRHGLAAEVWTGDGLDAEGDVTGVDALVIDTNTRSCPPEEAARRVASVAARCSAWGVTLAYKKVDSVLRGPVAAELVALLKAWGLGRCLLVPANPGLGRVISGGRYIVRGTPLDETDFALDPEYPAITSDVVDLLGAAGSWPVQVVQAGVHALPGGKISGRGILVGEATSGADLDAWAGALDRHTFPAGASEFFAAFLRSQGHPPVEGVGQEGEPGRTMTDLYVCGSTSAGSRAFCRRCEARGIPVLRIPTALLEIGPGSRQWVREWADSCASALEGQRRAMIAIDRPLCRETGMPQILSDHLSAAVERVLAGVAVDRLYLEGGATAVAVVRRLGWTRFSVRKEWATGVVSMQVAGQAGPLVSMKPGSYAWPDELVPYSAR
jgi:uncharacterized protein YgbK (DUF1537 family)